MYAVSISAFQISMFQVLCASALDHRGIDWLDQTRRTVVQRPPTFKLNLYIQARNLTVIFSALGCDWLHRFSCEKAPPLFVRERRAPQVYQKGY